jgi:glycosyltransferase involved in cell wall biosynthesis
MMTIAYFLLRFPHLTETFAMNEMHRLRELGIDLHIFSLLSPRHTLVHERARELLPHAHYSPLMSWPVVVAQWRWLRRAPGRYLRALRHVFAQTWREPLLLVRALVVFPVAVHFANQVEALAIEHLHAHFAWLGAIAAGVVADLLAIPFTIHVHAFDLFLRNPQDVRTQLSRASGIVAISGYHAAYLARLCPARDRQDIQVVYSGIETDTFRPAPEAPHSAPVRILSVGRLIRKKGFEHLIDACRLLADREVDFECQIVGDGPRRRALEARITRQGLHGRVRLLGPVSQAEVLRLYQQSAIFALPCVRTPRGDQDGLPYVLVEAMACGLPVVTTPVAGIPELVTDAVTGFLVQERDPAGLARALEVLIRDTALRQQLGWRARETIVTRFDVRQSAAQLAALFAAYARHGHAALAQPIAAR